MQRKYLVVPFNLKAFDDKTGAFSGYASVFGNVDLGYDVVMPGAFKEFVKNEDGRVVVLWQHDYKTPIASAAVEQDEKGLKFEGQLVLEDPAAQVARAHMRAKTVTGISIGYDILPDGQEFTDGGIRRLTALKLWEISVVTFPMNPAARVDAVKDAGNVQTRAQFEEFLRAHGFSANAAKGIAANGFRPGASEQVSEVVATANAIADRLNNLGALR